VVLGKSLYISVDKMRSKAVLAGSRCSPVTHFSMWDVITLPGLTPPILLTGNQGQLGLAGSPLVLPKVEVINEDRSH
jgi:hypothetical protein